MSNIILHIGLHKTATGALQRQFFPACLDLILLTTLIDDVRSFIHYVTRCDPIYFNESKALQLINKYFNTNKPVLLSNESLSGPPYAGVIEGGLDHRSCVLANLQTVFPEAKVILVLRRQDSMVKSFYRQYLKSGGTRSIKRFYGLGDNTKPPLMTLDRFFYSIYVEEVIKKFPSGVLLLAFEELIKNQKQFLEKITNFIGVHLPNIELEKENRTTLGPMGMEVSRILNHLFRSMLNPSGLIPGIKMKQHGIPTRVSPVQIMHDKWPSKGNKINKGEIFEVAEEIFKKLKEDNQRLDEKYQLDLKEYNYY
jgi:hypothetical protein